VSRRLLFVNPPVLAVDAYQIGLYAESIPFGLLQVATHFIEQGDDVAFVDMMGYADDDFQRQLVPSARWDDKPAGDASLEGVRRPVYLYGRSLAWLDERLGSLPAFDDIYVTCCISFNHEPAHAVIRACKQAFPKAVVHFGGFYPSVFPEHARASGAHDIHVGRFPPAESVFPRLDLLESTPPIWLFRLILGCKYRCSYCVNAIHGVYLAQEPQAVADEIERVHQTYGVGTFTNWDPNVMQDLERLDAFLQAMIRKDLGVRLKFEMGIQPDRLTPAIARRMKDAGVVSMTIPFESAEPAMLRRFGKPYRMEHATHALDLCRDLGFARETFHCTWVVGIRDESWRHVFRTHLAILKHGGQPTPFPLSPAPGTREYTLHEPHLAGKDLSELNGHLWPTLASEAHVRLYERVFRVINQPTVEATVRAAAGLPDQVGQAFQRELQWYLTT